MFNIKTIVISDEWDFKVTFTFSSFFIFKLYIILCIFIIKMEIISL